MNYPSRPTLYAIATEIRNVGKIWSIEPTGDGILFRAETKKTQMRVFLPRLDDMNAKAPVEKGTPVHVVKTLPALREWLCIL